MQIFSICWSYSEGINNLKQLLINLMLINNWLSFIRFWWIIWSYLIIAYELGGEFGGAKWAYGYQRAEMPSYIFPYLKVLRIWEIWALFFF